MKEVSHVELIWDLSAQGVVSKVISKMFHKSPHTKLKSTKPIYILNASNISDR